MKTLITLIALLFGLNARAQFASFNDLAYMAQGGGEPLLVGLQAAWNFDEQTTVTNARFTSFSVSGSPMVMTNVGGKTGSYRSLSGGGIMITNAGTGYLDITNTSVFGLNSSFTYAFWVCGVSSGANQIIGQAAGVGASSFDYNWGGQTFTTTDAGGGQHSAVGTLFSASSWLFVVCGYDAANNQTFISNNGGARVNVSAGGSVRQTANMPFRIGHNPCIFDNLMFWNRVLTSGEITRLYNSGLPMQYPFTATPGKAIADSFGWAVTNFSGTVTSNSLYGVKVFGDALVNASVWSKYTTVACFCPDSIQAALATLVPKYNITGGNDAIVILNDFYLGNVSVGNLYVGGDLTVDGLKGNGSSKYCPAGYSGVTVNILYPNFNDASMSIYCFTATGANPQWEFGDDDTGVSPNAGVIFRVNHSGVSPATAGSIGDLTIVVTTNTPNPGYYNISRDSSTSLKMYYANNNFSAGLVGTTTTPSSASLRGIPIAYGCLDIFGSPTGFSNNRVSYFSAGTHLSASDVTAEWGAVQTLRATFGGGTQ